MPSLTSHCTQTSSCPSHHSLLLHTAVCHLTPAQLTVDRLVGNLQHQQGCLVSTQAAAQPRTVTQAWARTEHHTPPYTGAGTGAIPGTWLLSLCAGQLHWFSVHCSRLTADKAAKQIIVDTTRYRCNCRRKLFIRLIHKYDWRDSRLLPRQETLCVIVTTPLPSLYVHIHFAIAILLAITLQQIISLYNVEISVSISPRALKVYNKVNMVDTVLDTFDSLTLTSNSLINVLVLPNPFH